MNCKQTDLIGWLYDVMNSLDWRVSILDVLGTEKQYPGLMDDLAIESWQRRIIKEQVEGEQDTEKRKTKTTEEKLDEQIGV